MNLPVAGRNTRPGFTLIEILVVVAILAVLAAILFPVFSRARENARRTTCASNMKQLGLAVMQYAQDFDERLPVLSNVGVAESQVVTWRELIQPYTRSKEILACTSNPAFRLGFKEVVFSGGAQRLGTFPVSYAAAVAGVFGDTNVSVDTAVVQDTGAFAADPNIHTPHSLASFDTPSQCICIVESTGPSIRFPVDTGSGSGNAGYMVDPPTQTGCSSTPAASCNNEGSFFAGHLGTSNFLFMDGHVKSMKPLATLSVAEGGTGTKNLWLRTGVRFTGTSDNDARANLGWSQNYWK